VLDYLLLLHGQLLQNPIQYLSQLIRFIAHLLLLHHRKSIPNCQLQMPQGILYLKDKKYRISRPQFLPLMVGVSCIMFGLADIVYWPDIITPLFRYQELLETSALRSDEHQMQIIQKLQDLHDRLLTYTPPQVPDPPKPSGLVRLRIIISRVIT